MIFLEKTFQKKFFFEKNSKKSKNFVSKNTERKKIGCQVMAILMFQITAYLILTATNDFISKTLLLLCFVW